MTLIVSSLLISAFALATLAGCNLLNRKPKELIKMCGFGCETKEENLLKQMITKLVSNDKGNKTKITYIR